MNDEIEHIENEAKKEKTLSKMLTDKYGKNIGLRLKIHELEFMDKLAKDEGVTRTGLIRKAVKHYKEFKDHERDGVLPASRDLVDISKGNEDYQDLMSHSLTKRIYNKGLKIHNEEGEVILKIKDLSSLFDFLVNDVFYEV